VTSIFSAHHSSLYCVITICPSVRPSVWLRHVSVTNTGQTDGRTDGRSAMSDWPWRRCPRTVSHSCHCYCWPLKRCLQHGRSDRDGRSDGCSYIRVDSSCHDSEGCYVYITQIYTQLQVTTDITQRSLVIRCHLPSPAVWLTNVAYVCKLSTESFVKIVESCSQLLVTVTLQRPFLAERTNGRAIGTVLRLSSSVTRSIVAKRCVLEQKLLLKAYSKSYMRNRLVPKWMTLTFV